MDFDTYIKLRGLEEEKFIADEIRPAAKQRLERSLIVDALIESEKLKLDQDMLKDNINVVMSEVFYSGNAEEMQKQMGKDGFTRVISMEGVQRTMNTQLQNRLKLIATGQEIPEDVEEEDVQEELESTEVLEEVIVEESAEVETVEEEIAPDEQQEGVVEEQVEQMETKNDD